ncbi:MAG: DUF1801 domain-containing protein [Microbacteriaceae bacterium]
MDNAKFTSFDQYFDGFPPETRSILQNIRELVAEIAPDAVEVFSYGMPTFKLNKKPLVYFAGYAGHIGLYATPSGNEQFAEKLRNYKTGKGSIQLPNHEPFPYDLVREIVQFRLVELGHGMNTSE